MALIDVLKPDFVFNDDRGSLVQIVHGGCEQVNAVFTKKGALRGNSHYHRLNEEIFFIISGSVAVTAELGGEREEYVFSSGDMFRVNRNVRHSFVYLEDTYLVGLYSGRVELPDGSKDIYTDEEKKIELQIPLC